MQEDTGVRSTGTRIALLYDRDLIGLDVEPGNDIDPALIDLGVGQIPVIRAPPIAGVPRHFFLSDKFGDTVTDGFIGSGRR